MSEKVFIGIPTYDDRTNMGLPNAILGATEKNLIGTIQFVSNSWLTRNFNRLLAMALSAKEEKGLTHFLLWHEDVEPLTRNWLDILVSTMEKNKADVLGTIIPIKSSDGYTSTAMDDWNRDRADPHYRVRRLTMTEVYENYPPTFTDPAILLNTGLMLIDLRKPWVEQVWFEFEDRIIKDPATGIYSAVGVPEDWNFSRKAKSLGASLWATREVPVLHHGRLKFGNEKPWGAKKTDE